jgi:threonine/homoserine/homoserine lactone efflux protein
VTEPVVVKPSARPPWALSWIALGVSIVVTTALYLFVAGAATGALGDNPRFYWSDIWENHIFGYIMDYAPPLVVVSIVLSIVAGVRGGRSRRVAVVAGLILASCPVLGALASGVLSSISNAS